MVSKGCKYFVIPQTRREWWTDKINRKNLLALSGVTIAIVLGLVGVVNYFAIQKPKQWDLTREGIYTLSEQTRGVLGRLDREVGVLAFYNNVEPEFAALEDVLGRYAHLSPHFRYEMVDPQSRPDLVEQYQITEHGPRIVLVAGAQEARAKDFGEEDLTNAVVKVAQGSEKTIYFLVGHGEPDVADGEHAEGYKTAADASRGACRATQILPEPGSR